MLIPTEEALSRILAEVPTEAVRLPLADCLGLRLAKDVLAEVTSPPDDASAMDGYAVRFEDSCHVGSQLKVIGEAPAGHPFDGEVTEGTAVRAYTGSKIPKGADHILIQENAFRNEDTLEVTSAQSKPSHIRKAGIDFNAGDTLLKAGSRLSPAAIAIAAAGDHADLDVFKRLKVGIIANGDELRRPGDKEASGDIISSNTPALSALIRRWGGEPIDLGMAKDDLGSIKALIDAGSSCDILLPVGGASVGDHDHMTDAFEQMGFGLIFKKVAVRPGKPTWFGKSETQLVLGLPGNPASAYVCAHLFLKPLLLGKATPPGTAMLIEAISPNGSREHYMRAIQSEREGVLEIRPMPLQDSSLLSPFLKANCLLRRLPNADEANVGDLVETIPLDGA